MREEGRLKFCYKGIRTKLNFSKHSKKDLQKIIGYLFRKYNIDVIDCEIVLHDREKTEFYGNEIGLSTDSNLTYYQQISFQFAHELTHAIQYKNNLIKIERLPYDHPCEIEARDNAKYIMHELLGYKDYEITE